MARSLSLLFILGLAQLAQAQEVTALAFSPDGSVLIYTGLHGRLEFVDGVTKQDLWHTQAHFGGVFGIAISPNGTHLAFGGNILCQIWSRPPRRAQKKATCT
jgi:WD40 repeat protein